MHKCSHQNQQKSHSQTVASLAEQLKDARREMRECGKEKKAAERSWQHDREDREREERKLRESLEKRDKLIEVSDYCEWLKCFTFSFNTILTLNMLCCAVG